MPPRRRKKTHPFHVTDTPDRDGRVPASLWGLPHRIEQANDAGPRYNQTELAQKAGLSQSVISKLASSQNLYGLRLDTIYRLSAALGVSVSWLLGESEAPKGRRPPAGKAAGKRRPAR